MKKNLPSLSGNTIRVFLFICVSALFQSFFGNSALNRILHAGATEWTQPREWAGDMANMATPPLVIKDFNMSTVSPGS